MAEETKNTEETIEAEVQPEVKPKKERKNKKDEEIAKHKAALENEHNLLLRTAAEFDNFKKRTEREKLSTAEYAKASVIKQLLPVIDNIDRAAAVSPDSAEYI